MLIQINMVERTSSCFKHFYAITVVVILLQLMNVNPSIGCIQRERQALLALKQGIVDDSNYLSSWGSRKAEKQDCCTWEGVRCSNRTGHVIKLDLGYQYLDPRTPLGGKLTPKALIEFQNLQYLDLRGNQFNGSLPSELGNLTNLQYLDLSFNDFTEVENLNWLPNLSSLQYLDLSSVNLSHVFEWSEAVDKLPQLRNLTLFGCDLPPPSIVSSVSKTNLSHSLAHVDISYNPAITSSIFKWLFNHHNSSLVYLRLDDNGLSGQISELVELLPKCSQNSLVSLDLSYNNITGSLPNLTNFQSLEELWLYGNKLSGTIPASIGQMSKLTTISVRGNSLQGEISEVHFSKLSNLTYLDLSSNSLVLNFSSEWVPPFQLDYVFLQSCKMGPYYPLWLRTQKNYKMLDISNAEISGPLPDWFWVQSPNLRAVDLSANRFTGLIATSSRPKFSYYSTVNLSHNQFEGPIPSFLSRVPSLDLSSNRFSGLTSFLCATEASNTVFLNISSNSISEELPNCRMHYADLVFLDLSHNALSGKVPATMGSLSSIMSLKLNSNRLVGELPSSLKNCRNLAVLDVGENKLSGSIPEWIGSELPNLAILIFRSNQFNGSMPRQLCYSIQARNLDFSGNNISGTIPSCLNNLTALAQQGYLNRTIGQSYGVNDTMLGSYDDEASFFWKGALHDYKSILGLVKRIDLSSNRITGKIPSEITQLVGLVSLNLSRNYLTGEIPPEMGKLKSLDNLDLSRNQIHGPIPTSLSLIDQLSVLDLSHNNLSGEIPVGTQLQRQDESNYAANPLLCGPPLERKCTPEEADQEQQISVNHQGNLEDELITQELFLSMGLGFAVGFWAVFGTFLHKYRMWSMVLSFFKGLICQESKNDRA